MKHIDKSSKRRKPIAFIALIVLLLVIIAIVLFLHMKREEDHTEQPSKIENSRTSESNSEESSDSESPDADESETIVDEAESEFEKDMPEGVIPEGVEITTPIGDLHYPEMWKDYAEVSYSSDDTGFNAVIKADIGDHSADILAIHIGDDTEGVVIGSAPDLEGNQVKISLELYDIDTDTGWSQSEIDTVYAMQEGINQLVEQIEQLYGYVPV